MYVKVVEDDTGRTNVYECFSGEIVPGENGDVELVLRREPSDDAKEGAAAEYPDDPDIIFAARLEQPVTVYFMNSAGTTVDRWPLRRNSTQNERRKRR